MNKNEVNTKAESTLNSMASILLVAGIIICIGSLIASIVLFVNDEPETGWIILISAIAVFLGVLVWWSIIKVIINISLNLLSLEKTGNVIAQRTAQIASLCNANQENKKSTANNDAKLKQNIIKENSEKNNKDGKQIIVVEEEINSEESLHSTSNIKYELGQMVVRLSDGAKMEVLGTDKLGILCAYAGTKTMAGRYDVNEIQDYQDYLLSSN